MRFLPIFITFQTFCQTQQTGKAVANWSIILYSFSKKKKKWQWRFPTFDLKELQSGCLVTKSFIKFCFEAKTISRAFNAGLGTEDL